MYNFDRNEWLTLESSIPLIVSILFPLKHTRTHTLGYPPVLGKTLLDKQRYVKQNLDYIRTSLMHEPRGHKDLFGALLLEKDIEEADIAILFLHNEGDIQCSYDKCIDILDNSF